MANDYSDIFMASTRHPRCYIHSPVFLLSSISTTHIPRLKHLRITGSGNTWLRLLIEYSTGVYTGSVYNDPALMHLLPGEGVCDHSVSAIKVHPHTHGYRHGESPLDKGLMSANGNCLKEGVFRIHKALLLYRNPYDAIWSDYQRRYTDSHNGKILIRDFDNSTWYMTSTMLAKQYAEMWVHFTDMTTHLGSENVLTVAYEDLKSDETILNKILFFLGYEQISDQKRDCVFQVNMRFKI